MAVARNPEPDRLGQLLLRRGVIAEETLARALDVQSRERLPLGEALVGIGVAQDEVWEALAAQLGADLTDPDRHWIDPTLANRLDAREAIKHRVLPMRRTRSSAIVAMADPRDSRARGYAEETLRMPVEARIATPAAIQRRQEKAYRNQLEQFSSALLAEQAPEFSAHATLTRQQAWVVIATVLAAIVLLVLFRGRFLIALSAAVTILYALVVSFRAFITIRGTRAQELIRVLPREIAALTDLPVYTILLPLYRESGVLPQLIDACRQLDYPSSKLDIKLLLEEDDHETRDIVERTWLPPSFDVLVVPAQGARTKPKACNYGLQFARGEYCVIFDAEDIPDPDQLKKSLVVFQRSEIQVGCVQARLNYYNPTQNAITKWFALEYASWFDFFLPGLVSLGLPVPLGGSSNHFPTQLLRDLGAWDPNNVTEDADLGMRLHRAGYQTALVDSQTLEEANSDFVNWMRQRSRWGKGYFISWLVLARSPRALVRDVGWGAALAMTLTLGGTFGIGLLNLAAWLLTALWALAQFGFIAYLFPTSIYFAGMIELVLGNFFFLYLSLWAVNHREDYRLTHAALLSPVYWVMASLAMVKAMVQTISRPTFWEKTVHGLFETPEDSSPDAVVHPAEVSSGGR